MTSKPNILTVVPARYASSRFPGKIIAPLAGKPLVLHAYERALEATMVGEVIIAADDQKVVDALKPYGANVVMTRNDHPCGTDRIAEVVANRPEVDLVVNVQGDEPLLAGEVIDATIQPLLDDPEVCMSTARVLITTDEERANPNATKVVCDQRGRALYFSRECIPTVRDKANYPAPPPCHWCHLGLYVYRRDFLLEFAKMPPTPLEKLESLEQLRALENGFPIAVIDTTYEGIGVDTPEDLARVAKIMAEG
jgi:3-deoxy-manno-octulosonate cytidylyltransferase (CMP-KDO synthetase)